MWNGLSGRIQLWTKGDCDSGVGQSRFLGFGTLADLLPYSSDPSPTEYRVWSILKGRARVKPQKSLELIKQSLTAVEQNQAGGAAVNR